MASKIDVESGNPYRTASGHFGESPNKALEASFKALQGKTFVPKNGKGKKGQQSNDDMIKARAEEAKSLLAALRGEYASTTPKTYTPQTEEEYQKTVENYRKQVAFSEEDAYELSEYTGGTYYDINTGLRNAEGNPDAPNEVLARDTRPQGYDNEGNRRRKQIKALDDMPRHELTEDTMLYRGVTDMPELQEGSTLQDYGFQSFSMDRELAESFMSKHKTEGNYLMVFQAKKGTKAIVVDAATESMNSGEREVLVERGTKYKAVKVEKDAATNNGVVYVEVF